MEHILAKKYAEVEELLDRFMLEVTLLSKIDQQDTFNISLNNKLKEFMNWIEQRVTKEKTQVEQTDVKKPPVKSSPGPTRKSNGLIAVPSFMLPTVSSIAAATYTPRSDSASRSNSTERARSNGRFRNDPPKTFMNPTASRSNSTERSRSTTRTQNHSNVAVVEEVVSDNSKESSDSEQSPQSTPSVYFSTQVTSSILKK